MAGREPNWRVIIGPYLACRFLSMDSKSENDLRSHRKFITGSGRVIGPGGSLSFGTRIVEIFQRSSNTDKDEDEEPHLHFSSPIQSSLCIEMICSCYL